MLVFSTKTELRKFDVHSSHLRHRLLPTNAGATVPFRALELLGEAAVAVFELNARFFEQVDQGLRRVNLRCLGLSWIGD
jgi:hypothetical protein